MSVLVHPSVVGIKQPRCHLINCLRLLGLLRKALYFVGKFDSGKMLGKKIFTLSFCTDSAGPVDF